MLPESKDIVKQFVKDYGWEGRVFAISAISGIGCKELTYAIMQHIEENKRETEDALAETGLVNESVASKTVIKKDN
jgi:GTP-binding protein